MQQDRHSGRLSAIRQTTLRWVLALHGVLYASRCRATPSTVISLAVTDYVRLVRELRAPPIPKLILYALAARADAQGICWPSIRTLCDDTGLARRTVQTHVRRIIQDCLVLREDRPGLPSVFRLNPEAWLSVTRANAYDAPVHDKLSESAPDAPPPRALRAGGAHDAPTTSAGPAPEVTKKYPLKLPGKLAPTESPTGASKPKPEQERSVRWWASDAGIRLKGVELGIAARPGESYSEYKTRLMRIERDAPP